MDAECCPCGDGGNKQVVNQDEQEILTRTTQGLQTRTEGMQEPGRH
jgi:hypothetical protein